MATPSDLAFLQQHPLLTPGDRRALLTLLAGRGGATHQAPLTHSISGVKLQRAAAQQRRIYRVFGSGDVDAPAEVAFEALSNLALIPAWDALFKSARYLEWGRLEAGGGAVEAGRIHLVYGLPGVFPVSAIVLDRDFVLRAVRVYFPSGVCVLCCRSAGAGEGGDGDPGPSRRMIRGFMWSSGYVVAPTGSASCAVNMSLQVDPKGWIPSAIVNLSLEAIPLNLLRLRSALKQLPPGLAGRLGVMNLRQAAGAKPLGAGRPRSAPGTSAAGSASGSDGEGEEEEGGGAWLPARESWDDVAEAAGGALPP
ncbi:MAG: hypothetical protein J3K34DRAFT_274967 [Monoraphidium minutum]|nr:MAG: hypothetical protein J3K34DRAFT_274967 [Monoraphidium minutum]